MAKTRVAQRRDAAEEVCWSLMLMIELGMLDLPMEARKFLCRTFEKWADLCVKTGVMKP